MLDEHSTRRQRFSTILLTAGVGMGALLCYLIAVPFLAAIVWSFTLAILFAPLDTRIRKAVRARGLAAAATLAIVAGVIVAPAITVIGFLLNEAVGSAPDSTPYLTPITGPARSTTILASPRPSTPPSSASTSPTSSRPPPPGSPAGSATSSRAPSQA